MKASRRTPFLLLAALVLPLAAAPGPAADGYEKFVSAQAAEAKTAMRKGDHEAAEAAWRTLLEFDPNSAQALQGMAEVASAAGDADAEALALRELVELWRPQVEAGDAKLARELSKVEERRAEIDPFAGEAAELLTDHRKALEELGKAYLEAGLHANAMVTWAKVATLVPPGSPEERAALEAIETCLSEGEDFVAKIDVPRREIGGKDEAWIAEHDDKTSKWSRAAERETRHYRVKTNAGWRMLNAAADAMESVHAFYREVWGIVPDPPVGRPDPELRDITISPIALNIYRTKEEYLKRSGAPEWSGGVFKGDEVATYDYSGGTDGESWRDSLKTLFHEASHQFMREAVGNVPSFVNEGVACLFEGIDILPNGTIVRDQPVMSRLNDLEQRIRRGQLRTLRDVMDPVKGNEPSFYSPRWGLFYYLRMCVDDQGAYIYRDLLDDYIYEFKKGTPGNTVEHFEELLLEPTADSTGVATFDEFEKAWKQWILDLKRSLSEKDERAEEFRKKARIAGLKKDHASALRFHERILDLDPGDIDALHGVAEAATALEATDRAVYAWRRFLDASEEDDARRAAAEKQVQRLDPQAAAWTDARNGLVGGMARLAQQYDQEGMPLMAMRVGYDVLELDAYEASARALVSRLERETGRSVIRWERLFNGYDLSGWRAAGGESPFYVTRDNQLESDYGLVFDSDRPTGEDEGVSLYRNLFLDRVVRGDWSFEARLNASPDWEIVGLCFGVKDSEHYEAIVLRKTGSGPEQNVDFGSFDGGWTFRGDGSYKAEYDMDSQDGVLVRIDVKGREVSVTIDGEPVTVVVDGKNRSSIEYPSEALRGDVGLLCSRGVTRFRDLRLLANKAR